ncbi:Globin-coupled histidine kinase [Planctomycetes bacterium Pan216]|uniref:histidine kinase n=1 Tax=Kolteria novifilia TaxID=2527975 RepID=A0A518B1J8_9BACT|nr:Globin-coupled histidine kinase [Planctomycetes bacterium Pan216]
MTVSREWLRYDELRRYVGWTDEDAERVHSLKPLLRARLPELIDDFYATIEREPKVASVIVGGQEQIQRLRVSLLGWLEQLLSGDYGEDYVRRRRRVGARHVEIGLDQVYTNVALSRLRAGLMRMLEQEWAGDLEAKRQAIRSLNMLIDLDVTIIEDAYQDAFVARLQEQERMATIGQVAGGVAHELRNPLNVVGTSAYYLLNAKSVTPEKYVEHLLRIERQVRTADRVITALADFARTPMPTKVPFCLRACIDEILAQESLPPTIDVRVDCADALPRAIGDKAQIGIAIANIIRNAGESMESGGLLHLEARAEPNAIRLSVSDTGTGVEPVDLERITEPLYSTKARGIGLGLALTKLLLNRNEGSLSVESTPGKGTTMTIRVPRVPKGDES